MTTRILSSLFLILLVCKSSTAFVVSPSCAAKQTTTTQLEASRRDVLFGVLASTATFLTPTQPAHATYSSYLAREKDWEERNKRGEIQYSTAKSLRAQLKIIAPMNNEGRSKIFCPNGPTAAVSPLMENKCSDALAMPSIHGQSYDVVGNSIPGRVDVATTGGMDMLIDKL